MSGSDIGQQPDPPVANSEKRQKAFASFICRGIFASAANTSGLATRMETQRALDVATFSLFELYRNSIPLGASAWLDVASE